jgi:hypothetical protein
MAEYVVADDRYHRPNHIAFPAKPVDEIFFVMPAKGGAVELTDTDPVMGPFFDDT